MAEAVRRTVCVDLDGTLCSNSWGRYELARPFQSAIARCNRLAAAGHRIVIFTARGTASGVDAGDVTREQLARWGVRYDELRFGKPQADVYIDDRAIVAAAWRAGDAFAVPGFPRGLNNVDGSHDAPVALVPNLTTVSELGRTYGGESRWLHDHAARALVLARGAGLRELPSAETIGAEVRAALAEAQAGAGGDLVFAISLGELVAPGYVDVWNPGLLGTGPPGLQVSVRSLEEAARGLAALVDGDGSRGRGLRATSVAPEGPVPEAWPLQVRDGAARDGLGGQLLVVLADELVLEPGPEPPMVAEVVVSELAGDAGLPIARRSPTVGELGQAGAAAILGLPFGLLPLAVLDGVRMPAGFPVITALMGSWSELAGVDMLDQILRLAGSR